MESLIYFSIAAMILPGYVHYWITGNMKNSISLSVHISMLIALYWAFIILVRLLSY